MFHGLTKYYVVFADMSLANTFKQMNHHVWLSVMMLFHPYGAMSWQPRKHEALVQCWTNAGPPHRKITLNKVGVIWLAYYIISWLNKIISLSMPVCVGPIYLQANEPSWQPSKHEALTQCWSNVGPPSATRVQHCTNRRHSQCRSMLLNYSFWIIW